MQIPEYKCSACNKTVNLHPVALGCFPATPSRAEVWYDHELLAATSASQHAGPTAIQAHCSALQQVCLYNGFGTGKPSIWTNLGPAAEQWRRVEVWPVKMIAVCLQMLYHTHGMTGLCLLSRKPARVLLGRLVAPSLSRRPWSPLPQQTLTHLRRRRNFTSFVQPTSLLGCGRVQGPYQK